MTDLLDTPVAAHPPAGAGRRTPDMVPGRVGVIGSRSSTNRVHVSLTRHDHNHVDTFIAEVKRRPEVLDCFATTGEADYHLRIVCADLAAYNDFLEGFLFRLPGIANVRTNLVLKDIKQETALAL